MRQRDAIDREPDVFHAGERAVQQRAGVRAEAARLGPRMVQSEVPEDFADFLEHVSFVYVAAPAPDGSVWVSVLAGPPGFAHVDRSGRVEVRALLAPEDPVTLILEAGPAPVGMLVLEPMSRSRIRLNGTAHRTPGGLILDVWEAFGNCPKHIARRRPVAPAPGPVPGTAPVRRSDHLDDAQHALVAAADTFFIGSRHPERGADASHRGGRPGFVAVAPDGRSLTFPDYQGNTMFQTLGNLTVDPSVGLLFVDWETGRTLQLTGRATIVWDAERIAGWDRAERLVDVAIDAVVDRPAGLAVIWELVEAHRLNPPVPLTPAGAAGPHE